MEPNIERSQAAPITALQMAHYGIIRMTHRLAASWGLNLKLLTVQGVLRQEGFFDALHERLKLPESYSYVGVFFAPYQRNLNIGVTSLELPVVQPYQDGEWCKPSYSIGQDDNGEPTYTYVRMLLQRERTDGMLTALDFPDLYTAAPMDYPF